MLTSREFVAVTLHSNQCKLGPTSLQIRILNIFFDRFDWFSSSYFLTVKDYRLFLFTLLLFSL